MGAPLASHTASQPISQPTSQPTRQSEHLDAWTQFGWSFTDDTDNADEADDDDDGELAREPARGRKAGTNQKGLARTGANDGQEPATEPRRRMDARPPNGAAREVLRTVVGVVGAVGAVVRSGGLWSVVADRQGPGRSGEKRGDDGRREGREGRLDGWWLVDMAGTNRGWDWGEGPVLGQRYRAGERWWWRLCGGLGAGSWESLGVGAGTGCSVRSGTRGDVPAWLGQVKKKSRGRSGR